MEIEKYFEGVSEPFIGEVTEMYLSSDATVIYHVDYTDNDMEDFSLNEIVALLDHMQYNAVLIDSMGCA